MNNELKLSEQKLWRGECHGFQIKIVHWGKDQGMNDGKGTWNYYVFLHENRLNEKFDELWLEPKVDKFLGSGREWVNYDYNSLKPTDVHWHGGVTFYAKHGEVLGHRAIELGCDYSHLWDHEAGFPTTLEDVMFDVQKTCAELNELYPVQEPQPA